MADPRATFEANYTAHGIDLNAGDDRAYMLPPDGRDGPEFMCAQCGQALQRLLGTDGQTSLIHERAWVNYDHDPEPVEIPAGAQLDRLCDFCGSNEQLFWHLKGDRVIQHTGKLIQDNGGTWGACATCGDLLKRKDLEALLDHSRKRADYDELTPNQIRAGRLAALTSWLQYLNTVTEMVYVGPRPGPAKITPLMMPKLQTGLIKFWSNPNLKLGMCTEGLGTEGKAWQVPLPTFVCGDAGQPVLEDFNRIFAPGVAVPEEVWDKHVKHQSAAIMGAELYWVSSQFTLLSIMAGKDFENPVLRREDLPSDTGFLIWQDSVGEVPRTNADFDGKAAIRAVHWTVIPDGVWVAFYVQVEDADPDADVPVMRQHLGWLISPNTGSGIRFGDEVPEEFETIRTFLATLFLLNQPGVAEVSTAEVDKREARKYQRNNKRPQPPIRLINLRKQPARSGRSGPTGPRGPITWREYRKGHWKQQPYGPKRGLRRPHYVSGYIAGPDGAPLRPTKPEVRVLK